MTASWLRPPRRYCSNIVTAVSPTLLDATHSSDLEAIRSINLDATRSVDLDAVRVVDLGAARCVLTRSPPVIDTGTFCTFWGSGTVDLDHGSFVGLVTSDFSAGSLTRSDRTRPMSMCLPFL